jgi:hypothetical protein
LAVLIGGIVLFAAHKLSTANFMANTIALSALTVWAWSKSRRSDAT